MACVYMHIDPEGKKYIGITKYDDPNQRWHKGNGYRHSVFGEAIRKFGWDNIEHIILEQNIDIADARDKEILYIKKYNTMHPYGYNQNLGVTNPRSKQVEIYDNNLGRKIKFRSLQTCAKYLHIDYMKFLRLIKNQQTDFGKYTVHVCS